MNEKISKKKKIDEEVEKTLKLMDNVEKLETNPYLYTRIKAQLSENKNTNVQKKESLAVKLMPAFFVLLVLFNFYSLFDLVTSGSGGDETEFRTEVLQEISSEYMLSQSSYYPITME